jgi:hypothetical protein
MVHLRHIFSVERFRKSGLFQGKYKIERRKEKKKTSIGFEVFLIFIEFKTSWPLNGLFGVLFL